MENKIKLAILDKIRLVVFNLFGEAALMKLQTIYWTERLKSRVRIWDAIFEDIGGILRLLIKLK